MTLDTSTDVKTIANQIRNGAVVCIDSKTTAKVVAAILIAAVMQHDIEKRNITLWESSVKAIQSTTDITQFKVVNNNVKNRAIEILDNWLIKTYRVNDTFVHHETPAVAA